MSTIRVITHHVTFIRVYVDPKRKPVSGYVRCTSIDQAEAIAAEMRMYVPPSGVDNAHYFVNPEVAAV